MIYIAYPGSNVEPIHATSGALAAQAAVMAGNAIRYALHTSSGALSAQAAAVAGTSVHRTLHASSGALAAQAATVAGAATVSETLIVLLQLRFEGATLDVDEENSARTNTFHTSGSPTLSSTSPMWGSGNMDIDAASTDENLAVTGDDFRASTTSDFTFEFWFYPISEGASQATSAQVLRHAIVTFCTAYPVTGSNYATLPYIWWHEAAGGTMGWANAGSSATGVSADAWHHVAYVNKAANGAGNEFSTYVDGVRVRQVANVAANFNTLYFGNMEQGSLLDTFAASYLTQGRFDSIRYTEGVALYDGASFTPPTSDFPVP